MEVDDYKNFGLQKNSQLTFLTKVGKRIKFDEFQIHKKLCCSFTDIHKYHVPKIKLYKQLNIIIKNYNAKNILDK